MATEDAVRRGANRRASGLVRDLSAEMGPGAPLIKIREIFSYRELLLNLIRKELKVRYKNSILGFLWSMLNPLFYLVVYYVVFNVFLPGGVPKFHAFLLAGLLPWAFFSNALYQSTGSITSNGGLLTKVYFPRELLPLSAIGATLFHFVLQFGVFAFFLAVTRFPFAGKAALLVPLALGVEIVFLIGMSFLTSALNVKARDVQYLLELLLLAWFWMTPIVYTGALVSERLGGRSLFGLPILGLYLANPMARVVLAFQRGIYGLTGGSDQAALMDVPLSWYLGGISLALIEGLIMLVVGWWIFHRMEGNFAEEI